MPVIKLPTKEELKLDKPGMNPARRAVMQAWHSFASDPTSLEPHPIGGMTRALKGKRVFRGGASAPTKPREEEIRFADEFLEGLTRKKAASGEIPVVTDADFEALSKAVQQRFGPPSKPSPKYTHYAQDFAGAGAGGDLYGQGIYLSEHQKIAAAYARRAAVREEAGAPIVRPHNLPPQAKIMDIHKDLNLEETRKILPKVQGIVGGTKYDVDLDYAAAWLTHNGATKIDLESIIFHMVMGRKGHPLGSTQLAFGDAAKAKWKAFQLDAANEARHTWVKTVATELGYDGVSFKAGKILGLPKGVKEGTRNYVIYNYDVINQPKTLLKQKTDIKSLPKKAD